MYRSQPRSLKRVNEGYYLATLSEDAGRVYEGATIWKQYLCLDTLYAYSNVSFSYDRYVTVASIGLTIYSL